MKPPQTCQYEGCKAKSSVKVRRKLKVGSFTAPMFYQLCAKHAKQYQKP